MRRSGWNRVVSGVIAVLAGLAPVAAWGQGAAPGPSDYVQQFGEQGEVNWGSGVITAKGVGVPPSTAVNAAQARAMAAEAAEVLARRNLLATIKGVSIDSQRIVDSAMMTSSTTQERISGFVRGAHVVQTREFPDGRVEVTVAMRLTGEFTDLVLPKPSSPVASPPPAPPAPPVAAPAPPKPEIFTGLVVDARGLNVRPAIAPKLVSEGGQEIYGSAVVDRDWAIREGMAGYSKDLFAAQSHSRVGEKPLVVKALRAAGANSSDVVVSNADAAKLLAAAENLSFLEKARVMIVVD